MYSHTILLLLIVPFLCSASPVQVGRRAKNDDPNRIVFGRRNLNPNQNSLFFGKRDNAKLNMDSAFLGDKRRLNMDSAFLGDKRGSPDPNSSSLFYGKRRLNMDSAFLGDKRTEPNPFSGSMFYGKRTEPTESTVPTTSEAMEALAVVLAYVEGLENALVEAGEV